MKTDTKAPERFLDFGEVHDRTGLSRATIWRREKSGDFPRRRLLGANRVGWLESEIAQWQASRPIAGGRRPSQKIGEDRDAA
jgi:prophage regulatory protein